MGNFLEARQLIEELGGTVCRCGQPKQAGNTFCYGCYSSLSPERKVALCRRIGRGYEPAYERACAVLDAIQEGAGA